MKKYDNFCSNLSVLSRAEEQDLTNEFIQSGIIDKFALQFELSWKLLEALLQYEGDPLGSTGSPREVLKGAYRCYDFIDEDLWLDMLHDRNVIEHTYDAEELSRKWLRTSGITAGIPVAAPLHHMDERLMHPEDRGTRWRRVMQAD